METLTNTNNYNIKTLIKCYDKPLNLLTNNDLTQMGLATDSRDPTGKYLIVIKASKVENIIKHVLTNQLSHKFVLAPEGYYWKYYTERCYYRFEWYILEPIPN
jgi:hypothetical protein